MPLAENYAIIFAENQRKSLQHQLFIARCVRKLTATFVIAFSIEVFTPFSNATNFQNTFT